VKDVYRHLFFDKVKSLGTDSCLYEIPKNDLVDDMTAMTQPSSPSSFPHRPSDFSSSPF